MQLARERGLVARDSRSQSAMVAALSKYSLMFDLAFKNAAILTRGGESAEPRINEVPRDLPNRFISVLEQMRSDEAEHAAGAIAAGGYRFPAPVKFGMSLLAKVMTKSTYRI